VLRLIATMTKRDGYTPSVRSLSVALGLSSMGSRDHLYRLTLKKLIEHVPFTSRTVKLTPAGYKAIGWWCGVCERPTSELYAIPGEFSMRCVPCAKVAMAAPPVMHFTI